MTEKPNTSQKYLAINLTVSSRTSPEEHQGFFNAARGRLVSPLQSSSTVPEHHDGIRPKQLSIWFSY